MLQQAWPMRRRCNWRRAIIAFALSATAWLSGGCARQAADPDGRAPEITVAAAADLLPAFTELGKRFEQESGVKVIFTFGSTGMLARQIENGAPIDLFAAADISFIEGLEGQGLIFPDTKAIYARGRIVIWTPQDRPLQLDRLEDLARAEVRHVAIANPEHAPYGMAAREAMARAGVWTAIEAKLVFGENVRQALQFAETGNAEVAIVALSLAVQSQGRWRLIPDHLHRPLDQALAVINRTRHEAAARRFAAFIQSQAGRDVMRQFGFVMPGEAPA